jgi:hypothetical protein
MNRTPAAVTGFAICVLLGVLDIVSVFGAGMADAPPLGVVLTGGALGLITVAASVPAWRGSRTGLLVVVASRAASILLGVPVYFDDAAPNWARIVVTIAIAASLAGIALLTPALRRPRIGLSA